jgi:hypothetical protein
VLFIQEDERIVMKLNDDAAPAPKLLGARPRTDSRLGMLKKFKNPDPEEDSDFAKIMARQCLCTEGGESIEMSNL